jgi:hypothetical protein
MLSPWSLGKQFVDGLAGKLIWVEEGSSACEGIKSIDVPFFIICTVLLRLPRFALCFFTTHFPACIVLLTVLTLSILVTSLPNPQ